MKRVVLIRSNAVFVDPAVEKVAAALIKAGHSVTILGWDRDGEYDIKCDKIQFAEGCANAVRFGIPATFGGGIKKNLPAMMKFFKKAECWLKENCDQYDVIHSFDFDTGLVAKKAAKKYKKKLCYHLLDFYAASRFKEGSLFYESLKKAEFTIINKADATIICTEARIGQIKGSAPKELVVIHNTPGYIAEDEVEKIDINSQRIKIVYAGSLEDVRLIREMLEIVKEDDRFELHIGGYGLIEEHVKKCAEECDRITFYGKLPYKKVLSLEKSCDIMTAIYDPKVANHKYAAPNKLYEAMMLSKPIIMCKNTGWDSVVERGMGVLIEYSKEGLGKGLSQLADKKDEWGEMGRIGRRLYEENYSWDVMEERLIELYEKL